MLDPKIIEVRTRSVERTLAPLVKQITTMVSHTKQRKKKGAPSKKAPQIAKEVEVATKKLVEASEGIARDFPEIRKPMLEACKEASEAGETMRLTSKEFANDPCNSSKRNTMVDAARVLLTAVTKLLCIADMADVYRLLATLSIVENRLKELETVGTQDELLQSFKHYGDDLMKLAKLTGLRQADLKDTKHREEIASARATLKKSSRMLLTTTKTYMAHPDVKSAQLNRDYVINEIGGAIATISGVAQAASEEEKHPYEEVGYLANALEEFFSQLDRVPEDFYEKQIQDELQALIDDIVDGASNLAGSSGTRTNTKGKIYAECENVKNALTDLLDEFSQSDHNLDNVDAARGIVEQKAKDLSKQLKRSVIDHVSDSFLETNAPLVMLMEAAKSGDEDQFEVKAAGFKIHAEKLQEVGQLACNISTNAEGIKMVKLASKYIRDLCPQMINAAATVCARPDSESAVENMAVFRDSWLHYTKILTEAVDDITTIDDFLAVTENHIYEDVNRCVEAVQEKDFRKLTKLGAAVRGRIARADHVVLTEMENYESGPYTEAVTRTVLVMRNNIIAQFAEHVDATIEALKQREHIDENSFIDTVRLVFDGMRDIRRAVQMKEPTGDSENESDNEYDGQSNLLTRMADEQAKQRERLAYEQLKSGGKVQFELHSEALDDPGRRGGSSIMVNGVEYCPRKRGHNIVVLDEVGTVVSVQSFDTSDQNGGIALAKFLDEIPKEHVALIAVQDTTGPGIMAASQALKRLGAVEPINLGPRSSWAFAGFSGDHENKDWISQVSRPRHQGPAMISDMINTPAADMGKILFDLHSEGRDDAAHECLASIKVNDIERSPMGRGMNVVVLDNAGNYLISKNFDTADPEHAINEGVRMSRFLNELPDDRIVCVASGENVGKGMREVEETLKRIGSGKIENPGLFGSFVFVGYTGTKQVLWTDQVACSATKGPAELTGFIITPAAEAELGIEEESETQSEYDLTPLNDILKDEGDRFSESEAVVSPTLQSARSKMLALPSGDKEKISKLAEGLHMEKNRLITEVNKWDDQGNDIIMLAKKMCMIMMEMSDFTRGTGPLKTTADVTKAAERIAKYGSKMNRLASEIAEKIFTKGGLKTSLILTNSVLLTLLVDDASSKNSKCPHSHTRSDLLAYLQRIALYSHQLTITARVKSDVQVISGEVIVSGVTPDQVDSATSLIQAAKNLMNSVILTVKASYIASTKHKSDIGVVSWRMRIPEKKPLVKPDFFKPCGKE